MNMRSIETLVELVRRTAFVVFRTAPPVQFTAVEHVPPLPATVKLPFVLLSMMPFVPPLAETLVCDIASGVVPLARVTSTAVDPVVVIAPLVDVMVIELSVASSPRWLGFGVMLRASKAIAPVLVVRLIPVPPDRVEDVLPKLSVALEVFTLKPIPTGLVMVVVGLVRLPATLVRLMPVVVLAVAEMLSNVAASVPVVRFSAWPVPFSVTSAMVSVPKLVPLISTKEFPPVKPRSVLPDATFIELLKLVMLTIIAFPLLVAGKGSL